LGLGWRLFLSQLLEELESRVLLQLLVNVHERRPQPLLLLFFLLGGVKLFLEKETVELGAPDSNLSSAVSVEDSKQMLLITPHKFGVGDMGVLLQDRLVGVTDVLT
jgi:hypothetical protein